MKAFNVSLNNLPITAAYPESGKWIDTYGDTGGQYVQTSYSEHYTEN